MTTKGSNNPFPHILMVEGDKDAVTPLPSVGSQRLVVDETDHLLYLVDDAGVATLVGGGGVSDHGALTGLSDDDHTQYVLRSILTTNGDLFTRAAGAVSRLGIGSTGDVLTVSGGAPTWAAPAGGGSGDTGALSLLTRRAVTNTEDDLFNAGTLDAKWLAYTGANPSTDLTALGGWCKTTTTFGYKLQAVPAGDWTIETEVIVPDTTAAAYQTIGLILTNGTTAGSATDARFGFGHNNSLYGMRVVFEKFVNSVFNATYQDWSQAGTGGGAGWAPIDKLFLKIVKSSTTYTTHWSTTGKSWHQHASTSSLGFTPTYFGFGGSAGSFFNSFHRY